MLTFCILSLPAPLLMLSKFSDTHFTLMVRFKVMDEPCLAVPKAKLCFHISLASQDPILSFLGFLSGSQVD